MSSASRLLTIVAIAVIGAIAASPGIASSSPATERAKAAPLRVENLRTESRVDPLGIDATAPRLSWILASDVRGRRQTAYRILAASNESDLVEGRADLWDSGKVTSAASIQVAYQGRPLHTGQRVHWTVRVWDENDVAFDAASPAWFEMGLLATADWLADWIVSPDTSGQADPYSDRPAPLFRKEFTIEKPIARARAYVTGLGYYELRLNGERVGDRVLDPGWTDYSKRVLYSTYDVTAQLRQGTNAVGAMLGRGWYDPLPLAFWGRIDLRDHLTIGTPRMILHLRIDFVDGTTRSIVTDGSWRCAGGPIVRDNLYLGEWVDARRETVGWDQAGFDDADWFPVSIATEPVGALRAQDAPPITIGQTLGAVARTEPQPGVFVFDLGQNFAGWARLRVRGPAGTRVSLRYGELLYPDGTLNAMTSVAGQIKSGGRSYRYDGVGAPRTAWQNDVYTLRGDSEEVFTPHFTFHGFRYVEVTGYPGTPPLDAIEGLVLHSAVEPAGTFTCSNEMFDRVQQMVVRTQLSNLFSVQSDCPHREKFGYGGDLVAASEAGILDFDMERFYAKTVTDFADAARPNDGITETAPYVGIADQGLGGGSGPVEWGTAFPLLQWQLYQYYGDREILARNYEATKRWIALLDSKAVGGILDNGISDHESLVAKPRALTGTAFYWWNLRLAERIARALGETQDADRFAASALGVRDAFNRRFLAAGTGVYATGTQACQAFALELDLAPDSERGAALEALVRNVESRQGHLSTGIFGTRFMLDALTEGGRAETAYGIVDQRTFPGWGNMLDRGATTLWEHWDFSDSVYSHNHPMFGSVSAWFFQALAGIAPDSNAVGFDAIVFRPQVVANLTWANARYPSVRGPVASSWRRSGDALALDVEVPVGAIGTVFVPVSDTAHVTESGRPVSENQDVSFLRQEPTAAVYRVGSGHYRFLARRFRRLLSDTLYLESGGNARPRPTLEIANPATGTLRMTFRLPTLEPASLCVYDIGGRAILRREIAGRVGAQTVVLAPVPAGYYFVQLRQKDACLTRPVALVR